MTSNRGDVVLVRWPNSDLTIGKPRPALVVQANGLATALSQVVVEMVSSSAARSGPPFRVPLRLGSPASAGTGLRVDSVVMADVLSTIHLREVHRTIGRLADMSPVDAALRAALGL